MLIGLLMAGVVLGGCGVKEKMKNEVEVKKEKVEQSLKNLMASGQAQKCTVKMTSEEAGDLKSEIWIKGKKMKQITKSETLGGGGEPMTMYVISDGEWMYNWSDKTDQGMKMKVEEIEKDEQEVTENSKGQAVDWETKLDYQCQATNIADSEFVPPASVEFVDWVTEAAGMQEKIEEQLKKLGITGVPEGEEE